ncbi:MAG: nucleotide exchange factor GrpE [Opitutales bacterium]
MRAEEGPEDGDADNLEADEDTINESNQLRVRLEDAYGKNAELQNNYLRKAADLDNMRKRFVREREEIMTKALTGLIEDLLPAVDAFRLGVDATRGKEGSEEVVKGFVMALEIMEEILHRRGLESINPHGDAFDPELHEAKAQEPSEEIEEGKIVRVVRVGYRLKERLVRAAEVIVSTGKAEPVAGETKPFAQ